MDTLETMQQRLQIEFAQRPVPLDHGQVVAWREAGDSLAEDAIVLLHGISSGAASWLGVAAGLQRLRPGVRVLAWDAPGYGNSSPLAMVTPGVEDYAQVLGESLALLGVKRCVLVGHSLGALIASGFACGGGSDGISHLVLVSPAGGYGAPELAAQRTRVRQQRLEALQETGVEGLAAVIDQRLAAPDTPELLRQWLRWNTARMQPGGYAQAVELLCGGDLGRAVGGLSMPVDVWVGEHDIVTPPAACADWARKLGARYATIADAGHAVSVEQAGVIAQKLADLAG